MEASHQEQRGRRAVITGASIAGLSAAFWLRKAGWDVTVIEKAEAFRDGGQNVDVRGVGREVIRRMGLFEAVKAQNTTETGAVILGPGGEEVCELPSEGPDGATAELEVLRGDLARILLDALPEGVEFVYDDTVARVDDAPEAVTVTTASGRVLPADLLVVAEGVRSSTRELVFGGEPELHRLGIEMVFGTIPRAPSDDHRWRWYNASEGRQVHLRPDNHGTTRAVLAFSSDESPQGLDRDALLARMRTRFSGVGWETERVLEGFAHSNDVYADDLTQVRMKTWRKGRVVLVGDAGWCVTPLGGGGASLALTGGYVLAAFLSRKPEDHEDALSSYESWMRPLVDEVQKLPPGLKALGYPETELGLAARNLFMKALTSAPLRPFAAKMSQVASTEQPLPELALRQGAPAPS